ncbi:MAG: hypothetical protein LAO56_18475 [Acidobacteriia bacterium]|nr:hypothetical protein [Terriglobia bacterium]
MWLHRSSALAVRNTVARLIADVYAGTMHPRIDLGLARCRCLYHNQPQQLPDRMLIATQSARPAICIQYIDFTNRTDRPVNPNPTTSR